MKIFTRFFLLLTVLGLGGAPARAANVTIVVTDNNYTPNVVSIAVGDTVTWNYATGNSSHPTMSDSSPAAWDTFPLMPGTSKKIRFAAVGVYLYHCILHGAYVNGVPIGMYGSIKVNPATVTATEDARPTALALNLFPNPSRGFVTVQLRQKPGPSYQLRLNNIIGQEIRSVALRPDLSAAGLPLDLSSLPGGLYFYSLLVDGKVASTKRLVLQN